MVDTPRTLAFLASSDFQDGQAAGSITPQDVRDLIATMGIRTGSAAGGGTFVRVTDPEFGADPTGTVNSTTAFQNAMAAGPCLVPARTSAGAQAVYLLDNCFVPNGAQLIAFNPLNFNVAAQGFPLIQALTSGTIRLFNVDNKSTILFQGLILDLFTRASATCDGISGGGYNMTLRDVSILGAKTGLGGAVAGSVLWYATGSWLTQLHNCQFFGCTNGTGDLIDTFVNHGAASACGVGFNLTSTSGTVTLAGTRFEESSTYGISIASGCEDVSFSGCMFDQNASAGAFIGGGHVNFTGCGFRRNGHSVTSGTTLIANSCHIEMSGASNVTISGCNTRDIQSDASHHSVYCPAAIVHFDGAAGNNTGLIFVGNNFTGCQGSTAGAANTSPNNSTTTWFTGTKPTTTGGAAGIVLVHNLGTGTAAQDLDNR